MNTDFLRGHSTRDKGNMLVKSMVLLTLLIVNIILSAYLAQMSNV